MFDLEVEVRVGDREDGDDLYVQATLYGQLLRVSVPENVTADSLSFLAPSVVKIVMDATP
jgi:hypothetical protein